MRCSVLQSSSIRIQCVAVCCSVLQRAVVCCNVLLWCSNASVRIQHCATCCSVLQCVAVCCSVLQCVAVCCSELQLVVVCCNALQCCRAHQYKWFVAELLPSDFELLQCVAVCCSVLQCVAVCCSMLQCVAMICLWIAALRFLNFPQINFRKYEHSVSYFFWFDQKEICFVNIRILVQSSICYQGLFCKRDLCSFAKETYHQFVCIYANTYTDKILVIYTSICQYIKSECVWYYLSYKCTIYYIHVLFIIYMYTTHGGDRISSSNGIPVKWQGLPFTPQKLLWIFGDSVKNHSKVTGTPAKTCWDFGSRNYFKSVFFRPWCRWGVRSEPKPGTNSISTDTKFVPERIFSSKNMIIRPQNLHKREIAELRKTKNKYTLKPNLRPFKKCLC